MSTKNFAELSSRIKEIRETANLSATEFAKRICVSPSYVSELESGKKSNLSVVLSKLISMLFGFEEVWIQTGIGPMRTETQIAEATQTQVIKQERSSYPKSPDFIQLPLFDLQAAAGSGAYVNGPEQTATTLAFRREWLSHEGLHPHSLVLLRVAGDSMEPTLRDRDVILVDRTATVIQSEKIYVIRIDSEIFVKRLFLEAGNVHVHSDNAAGRSWTVSADGVAVIGRVVWFGRRMI